MTGLDYGRMLHSSDRVGPVDQNWENVWPAQR